MATTVFEGKDKIVRAAYITDSPQAPTFFIDALFLTKPSVVNSPVKAIYIYAKDHEVVNNVIRFDNVERGELAMGMVVKSDAFRQDDTNKPFKPNPLSFQNEVGRFISKTLGSTRDLHTVPLEGLTHETKLDELAEKGWIDAESRGVIQAFLREIGAGLSRQNHQDIHTCLQAMTQAQGVMER